MRIAPALLGIALLIAAACGRPTATLVTQTGPESTSCREALAVRDEVLAGLEPSNVAAREQVIAAAGLGPCEDGDPNTGVAADLDDLRQRLTAVAQSATAQSGGGKPGNGKGGKPGKGRD